MLKTVKSKRECRFRRAIASKSGGGVAHGITPEELDMGVT